MKTGLIFLAVACLSAAGMADARKAPSRNYGKRDVSVDNGRQRESNCTISTIQGTGGNATAVTFGIHSDQKRGVEFKVQYRKGDKTAATVASETSRVMFNKIIEFVDVDGDQIFTEGTDTVASTYRFGKGRRGTMGTSWTRTYTAPAAASDLHQVDIRSDDGVVAFKVKFSTEAITDETAGIVIPPTAIKYDATITNYPYKNSTHGRLALVSVQSTASTVKATSNTEFAEASGDDSSNSNSKGSIVSRVVTLGQTVFSWADEVQVTDSEGRVSTANVIVRDAATEDASYDALIEDKEAKEKAFRTIFNFDAVAPGTITWDPISGVLGEIGADTTVTVDDGGDGDDTSTDSASAAHLAPAFTLSCLLVLAATVF